MKHCQKKTRKQLLQKKPSGEDEIMTKKMKNQLPLVNKRKCIFQEVSLKITLYNLTKQRKTTVISAWAKKYV